MNIFALDIDPSKAAEGLCDIHVIKMATETAQILCAVAAVRDLGPTPYAPINPKHRCVRWAAGSLENWNWLVAHGEGIHRQFMARRNKGHRAFGAIIWAKNRNVQPHEIPSLGLTPFADCTYPPRKVPFSNPEQAVAEYRGYYARKEGVWAIGRRAAILGQILLGKKPTAGNKPVMRWTKPVSRPIWMPPEPPTEPTIHQLAAIRSRVTMTNPEIDRAVLRLAAELIPREVTIEGLRQSLL